MQPIDLVRGSLWVNLVVLAARQSPPDLPRWADIFRFRRQVSKVLRRDMQQEKKKAARSSRHDLWESQLECDANTDSAASDDPALLSDVAIEKFKTIRQRHHWEQLKTCAACGIIDNRTGNWGWFRRHDELGLVGYLTSWVELSCINTAVTSSSTSRFYWGYQKRTLRWVVSASLAV